MAKTLLFEKPYGVYLPELTAYEEFIKSKVPGWQPIVVLESERYESHDHDVIWKFMGLDFKRKKNYLVHEYNSASTGRLGKIKNIVKTTMNTVPDRRVFLDSNIHSAFKFSGGTPYCFRPMGVDQKFLQTQQNAKKSFDLVYLGTVRGREKLIVKFLHRFLLDLPGMTLLFIGEIPDDIYETFKSSHNIKFTGRVPQTEVCTIASQAEFGLNLIPNTYPQNLQTSTKLLEYCALGLKIISTSNVWVRGFEEARNGAFFYLQDDLSNLREDLMQSFPYRTPIVDDLEWTNVIAKSGVFDFLHS